MKLWEAAVGWPGAAFYEELIERYPDAKVILTVRDPDGWYESALNTTSTAGEVLGGAAIFPPTAGSKPEG